MKIQAAVLHNKGEPFSIEEVELAEPKADEILVKIVASGVCHTDAVAREQLIPIPLPAVLGHEGSGVVEAVGTHVTSVKPGDHVVLTFTTCGECENCQSGHPSFCTEFAPLNFFGKMSDQTNRIQQNGKDVSTFFGQASFGTYAIANARNVVKVDPDVDLALLGPLACGIQTGAGTVLNKLRPEFGSSVAIFGCGAVGLSAVMAAKIVGCQKIIAIDIHDSRLALAKELGATHVFNGNDSRLVEAIQAVTNGGTNYAVETTGISHVFHQSIKALTTLGVVAVVGVGGDVTVNMNDDILSQGKTITGVIEGDVVPQLFIPKLIDYYKAGHFPFDRLVKLYELDEINQAFEDSKNGSAVKPIIKMNHHI
ncbi:NAD(P)-dependent alcohol dehydrogenase [Halalkalibacterium halodurans]|uniref:NAD(P)-dependent alcohol dehydrogenase n=1 Tax=Halalkalibacterium halodurans TaxID=86665 RepID=UPI002AAA442C|nr:NAD(P)-dependent alcohol dehydrogenase [Halalkalibacterium halodurans]MDY7222570.1 NAD(P)-dependent alcohol dehydrogenase [Halalkalibacterium halodurans]MDY7241791.1 NAD(P)-dependent alcohol dehydrogenase [Halalkalibacterium halodurans]